MSRNPMAGSLRHYRQRIVPDKRGAFDLVAAAQAVYADWLEEQCHEPAYPLNMIGLPDPDGTSQV